MISTHVATGLKVLWRHRDFLVLKLLGLGLGMSTAFAILVLVSEEFSFDRWMPAHRHIVRVEGTTFMPGRDAVASARAPGVAFPYLQQEVADVEAATRAVQRQVTMRHGDVRILAQVLLVDPSFLQVFELPLSAGSSGDPLRDSASAVLDRNTAGRLFGHDPPLGRTVTLQLGGQAVPLRVTAIIDALPGPTHLDLQALVPLRTAYFAQEHWVLNEWFANSTFTYLKLRAPPTLPTLNATLARMLTHRLPPSADGTRLELKARPLADIHLESAARQELKPPGSLRHVLLLCGIAAVALAVAALNYVNLALALSLARVREAALRTIFGATRPALAWQILQESLVLAWSAAALAAIATFLAWPAYDSLLGGGLPMSPARAARLCLWAALIGTLLGLGAGMLPALRFAGVARTNSLFMQAKAAAPSPVLREALILVQFAAATTLLICSFVAYAQARHLAQMTLGFLPDGLINLHAANPGLPKPLPEAMLAELRQTPGVRGVTSALVVPGASYGWPLGVQRTGHLAASKTPTSLELGFIGFDYFEVLGIPVLAGRPLSREHALDDVSGHSSATLAGRGANAVIDVAAARVLGFEQPDDAVGQVLTIDHWMDEVRLPVTVVGVVAAHRLRPSVTETMPARIFLRDSAWSTNAVLRLAPHAGAPPEDRLRGIWERHMADEPYRAETATEPYATLTRSHLQRARVYAFSAAMAVVIACLGLYGLVAYAMKARAREVAIRNVLGAHPAQLFVSLGTRLLRPILLAIGVAVPLAVFVMSRWLSSFVSRVDISAWDIGAAVAVTLATALAVVSRHLLQAVRQSPMEVLRRE